MNKKVHIDRVANLMVESEDNILSNRFGVIDPSFAQRPNLVVLSSRSFMEHVIGLTGAKPAPWPGAPWKDAEGEYLGPEDDMIPFARWTEPAFQEQFLNEWLDGQMSDNRTVVVDACLGIDVIADALPHDYLDAMDNMHGPANPEVVDRLGWVILPFDPDAEFLLFVCRKDRQEWVDAMREWCEANNEGYWQIHLIDGQAKWSGPGPGAWRGWNDNT